MTQRRPGHDASVHPTSLPRITNLRGHGYRLEP